MVPKGQIGFTWCVKIRIYRIDLHIGRGCRAADIINHKKGDLLK